MAKTLDRLEEELLSLSDPDRLYLLEVLLESVSAEADADEGVQRAWIEECRRRYEEIRSGRDELVDHEEVMAELRARFG
ncbi:MAG TPA: addiction module protein [Longimicrobiaceae bacterium]|nr:addiction module protein [Longimicrobiaceae bacterium]